MTVLVVGGAASGKSAYAERLLERLAAHLEIPRVYIATMEPFGTEAAERIAKHRRQREGMGFATVERYVGLSELTVRRGCAALLEDIGNLCANELFSPRGAGTCAADAVVRGVEHLRAQCGALVIVSNEVLSGGIHYAGDTLRYLRTIGEVNQRLAAFSDCVCEVVCGIPSYYKGKEPA